MKRLVTLTSEASGRYCADACPFLHVQSCMLFGGELTRSYKRKQNAVIRAQKCRNADAGEALAKGGEEKR